MQMPRFLSRRSLFIAVAVLAPLLALWLWPGDAPAPPPSAEPVDTTGWYRGALDPHAWPIDVSFLNEGERPAGRRGFVRAQGDQLVFEDGTPARFWGTNIAAWALFLDRDEIQLHAKRIAALGYNLVRLHHHDSMSWVDPTVIDKTRSHSQALDPMGMDRVDWWVKCLKDEGVYIWLDLHVGRRFTEADNIPGYEDLKGENRSGKGLVYVNPRLQQLMLEFNERYLSHVNAYTGIAYKDEPAVMGVLLTNENNVTHHFGNRMLPNRHAPHHQRLFDAQVREFAEKSGVSARQLGRTWEPGPSKLLLNDLEHRFNVAMIEHLRSIGVRVPVATTDMFGSMPLYSLPALTDGDVIDVHAYDVDGTLARDPRTESNYVQWIAGSQVAHKPLTVTEWNLPRDVSDRFTGPLYMMGIASLQGWDALMHFNYAQEKPDEFRPVRNPRKWSTYYDPAMTALMPAAAVAFRRGHVQEAQQTYVLTLTPEQLLHQRISAESSAAIRTLTEQSRLVVAMPAIASLPWLQPSAPVIGGRIVNDPDRSYLAEDATSVRSDTGELVRHFTRGLHTIDTPRTAAAAGRMNGEPIELRHARFEVNNAKAAVAVTSLDDRPIAKSQRVLISVVARVEPGPNGEAPLFSEPIEGSITVRCATPGLVFVPLAANGRHLPEIPAKWSGEGYTLTLPAAHGTHWFVLTQPEPVATDIVAPE